MSRRSRLSVVVCRGGRCGSAKHPDFDHDAQLASLRTAAELGGGTTSETECLALCSASNVVVVRNGEDRVFLGRAANLDATNAIASWLANAAPSPLPEPVKALVIDPDREFEEPSEDLS